MKQLCAVVSASFLVAACSGGLSSPDETRQHRSALTDEDPGPNCDIKGGDYEGSDQCASSATCPCTAPVNWNYYPTANGVYCSAPTGRLSVCSPAKTEICTLNYGGTGPEVLNPAICAACRKQFPVTANNVFGSGTTVIKSCSDP